MREVRFEVDGESVAGMLHEPRKTPLGALVLVHGFLSQAAEFADAGERLAERGWRTLAIDQRGFGASGGPRGLTSAPRAIADVKGALTWLANEQPGLPLGLVAHSMGACFALGAMATSPDVRAAVLAAPMSTAEAEVSRAEYLGYRLGGAVGDIAERFGQRLHVPYKYRERHLFVDRDAVRRAEERRFLSRSFDLANVKHLLEMDTTEYAPHVRKPVLVIIGEHDRAVKHASSHAVYDALAGPKELVHVDSGHSVFGDRDAQNVIQHVDRWFRHHLLQEEAA